MTSLLSNTASLHSSNVFAIYFGHMHDVWAGFRRVLEVAAGEKLQDAPLCLPRGNTMECAV